MLTHLIFLTHFLSSFYKKTTPKHFLFNKKKEIFNFYLFNESTFSISYQRFFDFVIQDTYEKLYKIEISQNGLSLQQECRDNSDISSFIIQHYFKHRKKEFQLG